LVFEAEVGKSSKAAKESLQELSKEKLGRSNGQVNFGRWILRRREESKN